MFRRSINYKIGGGWKMKIAREVVWILWARGGEGGCRNVVLYCTRIAIVVTPTVAANKKFAFGMMIKKFRPTAARGLWCFSICRCERVPQMMSRRIHVIVSIKHIRFRETFWDGLEALRTVCCDIFSSLVLCADRNMLFSWRMSQIERKRSDAWKHASHDERKLCRDEERDEMSQAASLSAKIT